MKVQESEIRKMKVQESRIRTRVFVTGSRESNSRDFYLELQVPNAATREEISRMINEILRVMNTHYYEHGENKILGYNCTVEQIFTQEYESTRIGDQENESTRIGDQEYESTRIGDQENESTRIGDQENESTRIGDQENESTRIKN